MDTASDDVALVFANGQPYEILVAIRSSYLLLSVQHQLKPYCRLLRLSTYGLVPLIMKLGLLHVAITRPKSH